MKNLKIYLALLFTQCTSQSIPFSEGQLKTMNILGTWYITEKYFDGISVLTDCDKKSYWKFWTSRGVVLQAKYTAVGEDCANYRTSTQGTVDIEGNQLIYYAGDIRFGESVTVISPNSIAITRNDIIDGKPTIITVVYVKK